MLNQYSGSILTGLTALHRWSSTTVCTLTIMSKTFGAAAMKHSPVQSNTTFYSSARSNIVLTSPTQHDITHNNDGKQSESTTSHANDPVNTDTIDQLDLDDYSNIDDSTITEDEYIAEIEQSSEPTGDTHIDLSRHTTYVQPINYTDIIINILFILLYIGAGLIAIQLYTIYTHTTELSCIILYCTYHTISTVHTVYLQYNTKTDIMNKLRFNVVECTVNVLCLLIPLNIAHAFNITTSFLLRDQVIIISSITITIILYTQIRQYNDIPDIALNKSDHTLIINTYNQTLRYNIECQTSIVSMILSCTLFLLSMLLYHAYKYQPLLIGATVHLFANTVQDSEQMRNAARIMLIISLLVTEHQLITNHVSGVLLG